jgi:hypothetical protein
LVFPDPIAQKPRRLVCRRYAFVNARTSMASPSNVPVP